MAINDGTNTSRGAPAGGNAQVADALERAGVNSGAQNPGSRQQGAQYTPPPQQAASQPMSFRNLGGSVRTSLARTMASEALSRIERASQKIIDEMQRDKSMPVTLIPIDREQTNRLAVSVMVIAVRDMRNESLGVAFHTLLIEASSDNPAPVTVNIAGRAIPVDRDLGEAADNDMLIVVQEEVNKIFPGVKQWVADFEKVPRDFKVDDADALQRLLANAIFAASQEIQTKDPSWRDLNLIDFQGSNDVLAVRASFGNPQAFDEALQPVRADIQIDLSASPPGNTNPNALNQNIERVSPLTRVAGYMDMLWAPPQLQAPAWNVQAQPSTQRYVARFIITRLEGIAFATPAMQLFSLFTAMSIAPGNAWVQGFRSSGWRGNGKDLHDIGAAAIETNLENSPTGFGMPLDTKADNFDTQKFFRLMQATFREGLMVSLHVPECGPSTWMNAIFALAAEGNPDAMAGIAKAANTLTNGKFSQIYQGSGQFVSDSGNRIQLGYFEDAQGVRHDLREIDYLAVLNLNETDPTVIQRYSDTFTKQSIPQQQRLADRRQLLMPLTGDRAVFTGYARCVDFETAFLTSLVTAVSQCGLNIRQNMSTMDLQQYERGSYNVANHIVGSGAMDVFNRGGYQSMPNGRQFQTGFAGRSFSL